MRKILWSSISAGFFVSGFWSLVFAIDWAACYGFLTGLSHLGSVGISLSGIFTDGSLYDYCIKVNRCDE